MGQDRGAVQVTSRADRDFNELPWIAGAAIVAFLLLILTACNTYEAVTSAPVEFWSTLGAIGEGLWADLMSLVELFF